MVHNDTYLKNMFDDIFVQFDLKLLKYYFCLVAKSYLTLWNAMNCSLPGSSVPHNLPEFAQIHVRWVSAVI